MNKYAYVISKNEEEMVKQVKDILKKKEKKQNINLDELQDKRLEKLYKVFNA